jgi:energy-coupling factor transport system substrate-specific component
MHDMSTNTTPLESTQDAEAPRSSRGWTTVDIVVTAVIAVVFGVVFVGWATVYNVTTPIFAALPAAQVMVAAGWFIPAVLAGLIVRKPGAALFAELVAANLELVWGSPWGLATLISGLVQGLGAELIFAAFRYRSFRLPIAALAGAGAGAGAAIYEIFFTKFDYTGGAVTVYGVSEIFGGALIAGVGSWLLTRALAATGVLDGLRGGRQRERV